MYNFILSNYLRKGDTQYVKNAYDKGYITEEEMNEILAQEVGQHDDI